MSVWILLRMKVTASWITCQPADSTRFWNEALTSPEATFVLRQPERHDAARETHQSGAEFSPVAKPC